MSPSRDIYKTYKFDQPYTDCMDKTVAKFGAFTVQSSTSNHGLGRTSTYYVEDKFGDGEPVKVGTGKGGKKLAKTISATLSAAEVTDLDILPPGMRDGEHPQRYGDAEAWEDWVAENASIPTKVATAGKAAIAGWLKVVHRERESWIANRLGVSETTVRQYLSDLRAGRR